MSTRPLAVIEDSDEDFAALTRALAGTAEVVRFRDGAEARECLRQMVGDPRTPSPAILVLDLNLPGHGGLEVISTLRDEPGLRRLPIVVLSGSAQRSDVEAAYRLGASAYVVKPLEFARFRALLEALWAFWSLVDAPTGPESGEPAPGYGLL